MNKLIQVLGTGCPKCQTLTKMVTEVVTDNNIDARIEKVEDIMEIMKFEVMSTPALVVDGVVTVKGKLPTKDQILFMIKTTETVSKDSKSCSGDKCC